MRCMQSSVSTHKACSAFTSVYGLSPILAWGSHYGLSEGHVGCPILSTWRRAQRQGLSALILKPAWAFHSLCVGSVDKPTVKEQLRNPL
jgi:hypothetical protein